MDIAGSGCGPVAVSYFLISSEMYYIMTCKLLWLLGEVGTCVKCTYEGLGNDTDR